MKNIAEASISQNTRYTSTTKAICGTFCVRFEWNVTAIYREGTVISTGSSIPVRVGTVSNLTVLANDDALHLGWRSPRAGRDLRYRLQTSCTFKEVVEVSFAFQSGAVVTRSICTRILKKTHSSPVRPGYGGLLRFLPLIHILFLPLSYHMQNHVMFDRVISALDCTLLITYFHNDSNIAPTAPPPPPPPPPPPTHTHTHTHTH